MHIYILYVSIHSQFYSSWFGTVPSLASGSSSNQLLNLFNTISIISMFSLLSDLTRFSRLTLHSCSPKHEIHYFTTNSSFIFWVFVFTDHNLGGLLMAAFLVEIARKYLLENISKIYTDIYNSNWELQIFNWTSLILPWYMFLLCWKIFVPNDINNLNFVAVLLLFRIDIFHKRCPNYWVFNVILNNSSWYS